MHFIDMGNGTLFGVKDGSTDTYRVIETNDPSSNSVNRTVEQLDPYPAPARTGPALLNVNGRFAYMIAGEDTTSCLRFDN